MEAYVRIDPLECEALIAHVLSGHDRAWKRLVVRDEAPNRPFLVLLG
jgi:hypothetical protein